MRLLSASVDVTLFANARRARFVLALWSGRELAWSLSNVFLLLRRRKGPVTTHPYDDSPVFVWQLQPTLVGEAFCGRFPNFTIRDEGCRFKYIAVHIVTLLHLSTSSLFQLRSTGLHERQVVTECCQSPGLWWLINTTLGGRIVALWQSMYQCIRGKIHHHERLATK